MKARIKKSSRIHEEKLYCLEDIFGECDGHGAGFLGEDIDWQVEKHKGYYTSLYIDRSCDMLDIGYRKYPDAIEGAIEEIPLSSLPRKWKNRLLKALKEHTRKRIISDD